MHDQSGRADGLREQTKGPVPARVDKLSSTDIGRDKGGGCKLSHDGERFCLFRLFQHDSLTSHSEGEILLFTKFCDLGIDRSEEHTSELQSRGHLVCRLLLEKKNITIHIT